MAEPLVVHPLNVKLYLVDGIALAAVKPPRNRSAKASTLAGGTTSIRPERLSLSPQSSIRLRSDSSSFFVVRPSSIRRGSTLCQRIAVEPQSRRSFLVSSVCAKTW